MDMGYVVYVVGKGYLTDSLNRDPWYLFSEEIIDAVIFDDFKTALIVQKHLCWGFFKGKEAVMCGPFPASITIGG